MTISNTPMCPETGYRCSTAYVKGCRCEACAAHKLTLRAKYRTKQLETQRRRETSPEGRAVKAAYRMANKDRRNAIQRFNRQMMTADQRAELNVTRREHYSRNADAINATARQWKLDNPSNSKGINRRKKLKRRSADQTFFEAMTREEHERFYTISNFYRSDVKTHVDHVLPVALGGTSHPDNLCVLTEWENRYKSDTHPLDCDLVTVPLAGSYTFVKEVA